MQLIYTQREQSSQFLIDITSNDRSFCCPIIYINTNLQCYFVHRHSNIISYTVCKSILLLVSFLITTSI